MNKRLEELEREKNRIISWLFLVRCMVAWLPLVAYQLYLQKPFTLSQIVAYLVGIPVVLYIYDRLFLK